MVFTSKIAWNLQKQQNIPPYIVEILGDAHFSSKNKVKFNLIYLIRYIHDFCESSLQYGDCKKNKTCQQLQWIFKFWPCPSWTKGEAYSYIYLIRYIHGFFFLQSN